MYHGGKIRSRNPLQSNRDVHAAHHVHLTLNTNLGNQAHNKLKSHQTLDKHKHRYVVSKESKLTNNQSSTIRNSETIATRKYSTSSDSYQPTNSYLVNPVKKLGFNNTASFLSKKDQKTISSRHKFTPSPKFQNNDDHMYESGKPNAAMANSTEKVLFAENVHYPGVPIVYRTPDEKSANPDRINLDRRNLKICPILRGEELVRLLNFQHNVITKVENLNHLQRLIFLDLYDNKIENMVGVSQLTTLRVLMLGKNKITKIQGLQNLLKLDVLDLHGNQIKEVENLTQLRELRVLNLAGNLIEVVTNLKGMATLTELNFRRNNITSVEEVDSLPSLLRLFLSYNDIENWEDIACLGESESLLEVTLDGNPINSDAHYKQVIIKNMKLLKQLDMKRVTDEERRIGNNLLKKEKEEKRELHRKGLEKERKRALIYNCAIFWRRKFPFNEIMLDSTFNNDKMVKTNSWIKETVADAKTNKEVNLSNQVSNLSLEDAKLFLTDIENSTLYLFGNGSLNVLEKYSSSQLCSTIHTIEVYFVEFDHLTEYFELLRAKFQCFKKLVLNECSVETLPQLNSISNLKKLQHLYISEGDANPVTQMNLWKFYCIFRLKFMGLQFLNDQSITDKDVVQSEKVFGNLTLATTSKLSKYRLSKIYADNQKKRATNNSSINKDVENIVEPIGVSALKYQKEATQIKNVNQNTSKFVEEICKNTCNVADKQNEFCRLWPTTFVEMTADVVLEMHDVERYVRNEALKFYAENS